MLPYSQGLTFLQWSAYINEAYAAAGVQVAQSEDGWREWGDRLQEIDTFNAIPRTAGFQTWQAWSERVIEALN